MRRPERSAVFIAAGAQSSKKIGILGEEENVEGLFYGLQFLEDIREGKEIKKINPLD